MAAVSPMATPRARRMDEVCIGVASDMCYLT